MHTYNEIQITDLTIWRGRSSNYTVQHSASTADLSHVISPGNDSGEEDSGEEMGAISTADEINPFPQYDALDGDSDVYMYCTYCPLFLNFGRKKSLAKRNGLLVTLLKI
jgi:hypothetical protein